jgi:hypothetical protein
MPYLGCSAIGWMDFDDMLCDRNQIEMQVHIDPESLYFEIHSLYVFVARAERFPVGNFLVNVISVCLGGGMRSWQCE